MKYENPNNAAFFFDDGDFVNLEYVAAAAYYAKGERIDPDDGTENNTPVVEIDMAGADKARVRPITTNERKRLSDALRVYHSKL